MISIHSTRHTWATCALAAGVNPRVVQAQLGHSTVALTLDVYSHVTSNVQADAVDKVAAIFGTEGSA